MYVWTVNVYDGVCFDTVHVEQSFTIDGRNKEEEEANDDNEQDAYRDKLLYVVGEFERSVVEGMAPLKSRLCNVRIADASAPARECFGS